MAAQDGMEEEEEEEEEGQEIAVEATAEELEWLQAQLARAMEGDQGPSDAWEDPCEGKLTELLEACNEGDVAAVKQLLDQRQEHGLDINHPGPDGDTALHIASLYGHEEVVAALLEAGADASIVNQMDQSTAHHDAAATGDPGIIKRLLQAYPGHVNHADEDGDTPLHNAARGNNLDVVHALLEAGADKAAVNGEGNTPAQEAEEEEVVSVLQTA